MNTVHKLLGDITVLICQHTGPTQNHSGCEHI